ncbi:MAG: asparagine synthase (glutamine-hydrolyzing) [Rhodospirillaceae bacterium]|nr:asparagine synthase (glutamine-hydrolyzing) [Rhodospirillaceae bacterium]
MCGITGILSFSPETWPVDEATLITMRDTMIHRGPDGAGVWRNGTAGIGFGHRRLAIIDLSDAALQPMHLAEETLSIVFNGEIYNHAELREELTGLGHSEWKTDHSDTEVILHAFQEWGIDCLQRFRGMFAIALWDDAEKELWLIRDRVGIKPLYYALDERGIVFASEIKAILAGPDRKRAVNEEAFFHYLSFLTTPAPMTLFDGIEKLAAGTWTKISATGEIQTERWWDAWDGVVPNLNKSDSEIAEEILAELDEAVGYRKVGDVPIGVFLSGGVDSSTNVALFSKGEDTPVKTFAIGYEGGQESVANELPYARMIAEQVGAEHHEYLVSQDDLLSFLPDMIRYQDEPIADPVCVPVYYVSKLARNNGVTVCQVGEGADELFWGYESWKTFLQLERANNWPVPRFMKKLGVGVLTAFGFGGKLSTEFLRRASLGQPIFWGGAEAFPENAKWDILSPRLKEKFSGRTSWEALAPIRERFEEKAWDTSALSWMTYLDLNLRLPELLLMRVDKMSMATSIEARVPFLDHKFIRHALGISPKLKTKTGELKHILKRAVRGLIPDQIIDRKKQGFAVPIDDWSLGRLGETANDTLRAFCKQTDFLDKKGVEKVLRRGNARQIWYLLNFALWWEEYIKD